MMFISEGEESKTIKNINLLNCNITDTGVPRDVGTFKLLPLVVAM